MTQSSRSATRAIREIFAGGSRDEREFLPAALEVIETPASPTGRLLAVLIIALFSIAFIWGLLGHVDVIATAPVRLTPAGSDKIVQPSELGVVKSIRVENGDHVRAGQLLVELDPTQPSADSGRLDTDRIQAELDVGRLLAVKSALESGKPPRVSVPPEADPILVEQTRAAARVQVEQAQSRIADLGHQINQKRDEASEVEAQIQKIRSTMPMLLDKQTVHRELTAQGYGLTLAYLDSQQQVAEAENELKVEQERGAQAVEARGALERQRDEVRAGILSDVLSDLRKAQDRLNASSNDLVKARDRTLQTEIRAPIDGYVADMSIHTLHGVVTPAQALMTIVPDDRALMVEARLANRDVGFVRAGQHVEVKVETYAFTRYGLLDADVVDVSRDIARDEDRQGAEGRAGAQAPARSASPVYVARIRLRRSEMDIDGRLEPLKAGMSVTAEIKTGSRSIIDYLLSPLSRRVQESFHER